MRFAASLRSLAGISLLFCLPAVAQTRFCLGGDLEHLSRAERSACSATLDAVRQAAATLQAPADWHFVVVCGEQGWKDYSAFAFSSEGALENLQVSTNAAAHETFLRGADLDDKNGPSLQQLVAKELGTATPVHVAFGTPSAHRSQTSAAGTGL